MNDAADTHDIVVNGVRLGYAVTGEADAPPMVLLHALGQSRADWAPLLAPFGARYRVYAIDQRGHGSSEWPGDYSFDALSADITAFLDALGLTGVTVVGHSMGGVVAYRVALARPDLVSRIVIEDAPPPYPRDRAVPHRPDGPLGFDWAVVPAIVNAVSAGDVWLWDALATISAPALLIGGGPDSHVPQDVLADAAGRIPAATLRTIPAGHDVHAGRAAEFADAVLDWAPAGRQPASR